MNKADAVAALICELLSELKMKTFLQ